MADLHGRAQEVNPYSASAAVGGPQLPGVGAWRDGQLLVMHKDAELPHVCIYTGQKAVGAREFRMIWRRSGDLFTRGKYIYLPLCREHLNAFARQRLQSLIGLACAGIAILAAIAVGPLASLTDQVFICVLPPALFMGFVGVILWIVAFQETKRPLKAVHADGDYIWLEGVCSEFLRHLPEWGRTGIQE